MEEKNKEAEIDLLELGKKLWDNKKFIIKATLIGVIMGLIIAFSIPKEYTTAIVFVADTNKSASSSMSAIASLAGVNLGNMQSSEMLSPNLYPSIIYSTPFVQGLIDVNVKDPQLTIDTTLCAYMKDGLKHSWWSYIFGAPKMLLDVFVTKDQGDAMESDLNPYFISDENLTIIERIKNSYNISTDNKTNLTTLQVTLQSSKISAFLADTITAYLQSYIIEQRTKKAKKDLENSQKLYIQAKEDYFEAQQNLASFVDANQHLISARYRTNQEKLQNEVNLTYSVYTQMAQQIQMDKIKVQDDTPVFTIIQPAIEQVYPSSPKKKIIILFFIFFSLAGTFTWILRKEIHRLFE